MKIQQKNPDILAQKFVENLAKRLEKSPGKIVRYAPSVKLGRRYLAIEGDEFVYAIQVDVRENRRQERRA